MYHKLIDKFYFEHHVHINETASRWGSSMERTRTTMKDSLDLFFDLREKGSIPANCWQGKIGYTTTNSY